MANRLVARRGGGSEDAGIRRRRALAEALMVQPSGQPPEWSRMPVMPSYGIGHALADLGTKLTGAWMAKGADEDAATLEQQKRDAIAKALEQSMLGGQTPGASSTPSAVSGAASPAPRIPQGSAEGPVPLPPQAPQPENPRLAALRAAMPGMSTEQMQALQTQMLIRSLSPEQAREGVVVSEGGTLVDPRTGAPMFQSERKRAGTLYPVVGEGGRPRYATAEEAAGMQPYREPPAPKEAPSLQLTTRPTADGQRQDFGFNPKTGQMQPVGEPYAPQAPLSPKDTATAKQKLTQIRLARQMLNTAKERFTGTEDAPGIKDSLSAGLGGGLLPTEAGKQFDGAVDSMRNVFTSITRVPGVGAMSDFETRLQLAQFPDRGEYESVTAQKLQSLDDMLTTLETGYGDLLAGSDGSPPPAPPPAPPSGAGEPVRVNTPEEAAALPPGTVFLTPDGRRKVR